MTPSAADSETLDFEEVESVAYGGCRWVDGEEPDLRSGEAGEGGGIGKGK